VFDGREMFFSHEGEDVGTRMKDKVEITSRDCRCIPSYPALATAAALIFETGL
jgi:hypothetical protein